MEIIRRRLFELQDEKYGDFSSALMPTIKREDVIGIRIPILRKLAKEVFGTDEAQSFLSELPHRYFEENNLHAFLVCMIKDFDECIVEIERFLPYVDNWSTCDSLRPTCFSKNKDRLLPKIYEWMNSDHTYTKRFAIELLMVHFLGEGFDEDHLTLVERTVGDDYYLKMMKAWYYATALAKQYDKTVDFMNKNMLDDWVHNKTIQKAMESYRVSDEHKEYLRSMKRK